MKQFKLNNHLSLSFEPLDKSMRIIIAEANEELACRKETIKNLENFLKLDEGNVFKGRLQLSKKSEQITIILKGKPIGKISLMQLQKAISKS